MLKLSVSNRGGQSRPSSVLPSRRFLWFPFLCSVCPQVQNLLCTEGVLVTSAPLVTVRVLNPLLLHLQEVSQIALLCSLKSLTHGNGD